MASRRSFLSAASQATVFYLAGRRAKLKAAPATSPSDQLPIGLIGSGIRGTQLIEEFKPTGVRFLAAADLYDGVHQRLREQVSPEIKTSKDYRAVLDNKDVEAVIIATPDHWHKQIVLDALSAGKHVYCEKPLTWSLEEGPEIIKAEKASGKVLQVGSQHKTSTLTAKAREIIKSGQLGQVTMVRIANHRNNAQGAWKYEIPPDASPKTIDWQRFLGSRPQRPFDPKMFFQWRCWWEFSGGVATDLFVHLLTWLHEVMDVKAPVSVASQGGLYFWKDGRNVPDVLNSVFEYDGFIADMYVHLANNAPTPPAMIMGTKGTLIEENNSRLTFYPASVDLNVQSYGTLQWPKAMRAAYFESKGWTADGRPKTRPQRKEPEEVPVEQGPSHADCFVNSVRNKQPSRENATEGHLAAGAAHVANISYREQRKVRWDWRTNTIS